MLLSMSLIFLCGLALGWLFRKFRLPGLLGMLVTGMLLAPFALNLLDQKILLVSPDLRQLALIIILARAGLSLDTEDLKQAGRPAFLLCFVPACVEITAMVLLAPRLLGVSVLDAAVMGTVVAAVSPAVIVPRMLDLMAKRLGTGKKIPQMILAGASVDDVFVIVLFTVFISLAQNKTFSPARFLAIPTAIFLGLLSGFVIGLLLSRFFTTMHIRDSGKVVIILSISFLLVSAEQYFEGSIGFSGLLAVMAVGMTLKQKKQIVSKRLSLKFEKLWVAAEVLLFVLVGAAVDVSFALKTGLAAVWLVLLVVSMRFAGVMLCLIKTNLDAKERIFVGIAYLPKATVQAAIGGVPLAMGLASGNMVLTVAVLSIILTAPIGAVLIDALHRRLLTADRADATDAP